MIARFFRSDAMADLHGETPEVVVESEWFQLTYNDLRSAPDGDHVAAYNPRTDVWELNGCLFSDIVISHEEVPE